MPRSLDADQLEQHYGGVLRSFGDVGARVLKNKLKERYPSVEVGDQSAFRALVWPSLSSSEAKV